RSHEERPFALIRAHVADATERELLDGGPRQKRPEALHILLMAELRRGARDDAAPKLRPTHGRRERAGGTGRWPDRLSLQLQRDEFAAGIRALLKPVRVDEAWGI